MRGHEYLIQMRLAGKAPEIVFINDYPCDTDWHEFDEHATISTDKDTIQSLDLRFLVGLQVSISSPSETRAKALFNAVKKVNPRAVVAAHVQDENHYMSQTGWIGVYGG